MQQPPNQDGGGTTGELRSDAKELGSTAANRLHSEVDARKGQAVGQAQSVSSAISQAADGLDESSPEWLRSAFRQGAQQIQRFADTIEQKDSRQLMAHAQDFARNNPGTFLAACAAAGFAAARVLKAGGEQQSSQQFSGASSFGDDRQFGEEQSFRETGNWDQSREDDNPMFQSSGSDAGVRANPPGEFA